MGPAEYNSCIENHQLLVTLPTSSVLYPQPGDQSSEGSLPSLIIPDTSFGSVEGPFVRGFNAEMTWLSQQTSSSGQASFEPYYPSLGDSCMQLIHPESGLNGFIDNASVELGAYAFDGPTSSRSPLDSAFSPASIPITAPVPMPVSITVPVPQSLYLLVSLLSLLPYVDIHSELLVPFLFLQNMLPTYLACFSRSDCTSHRIHPQLNKIAVIPRPSH